MRSRPPRLYGAGDDRAEIERNARTAVAARVELLRSTGRPVPDPSTYDTDRIAI
jgi:predicted RNase H-like HicB family nuclease